MIPPVRTTRAFAGALLAALSVAMPLTARSQVAAGSGAAKTYPGRLPYVAADVQFVTGMISHHAQAIIMANWAPSHGGSQALQALCARIINAQGDEIRLMQMWLRDRQLPVPEAKPMPTKMTMNGMEHEMLMPGMLTDDQMKQLDAARDAQFDKLFLRFMIQHHQGAVAMVEQLLASTGAAQDEFVFRFQSDVYADQTTEIDRMQKMLFTLQLTAP